LALRAQRQRQQSEPEYRGPRQHRHVTIIFLDIFAVVLRVVESLWMTSTQSLPATLYTKDNMLENREIREHHQSKSILTKLVQTRTNTQEPRSTSYYAKQSYVTLCSDVFFGSDENPVRTTYKRLEATTCQSPLRVFGFSGGSVPRCASC